MKKLLPAVLCCFLLCFGLAIRLETGRASDADSRLRFEPVPLPQVTEEPPAVTLPLPTIAGTDGLSVPPEENLQDAGRAAGGLRDTGTRFPFDQQTGSFPRDIQSDHNLLCSILQPSENSKIFNNELQIYQKSQAQVLGNHIYMTADRDGEDYISGMVKSSIAFQYCDLTLRIHTLEEPGLLPAIWMLPDSGVKFPEVDLYEAPGNSEGLLFGVLHYFSDNVQQRQYSYTPLTPDTQELRLLWTQDQLSWFVDGQELLTITENIPREPMYLIFNLAVGGDWPGDPTPETRFPAIFHVEILDFQPENIRIR